MKSISTNANLIHVAMERHAGIKSINMFVHACPVIPGYYVKPISMIANLIHVNIRDNVQIKSMVIVVPASKYTSITTRLMLI